MALSDIANTRICWRKAEIQDLLKGFSVRLIKSTINQIVSTEMNISIDEAKKIKTVKPSIVKIILKDFE
ncbi:hypothetical protein [Flavobacterium caseinilyticum]|uniref:Uncharacterized protein n=1 Tax=Flavobacterium caseinilyticum TaxID=2541732 RepID=A0A4R5ANQ4_9FLAO|nr:hypothetical protein [Flavobacterium caseinilyticum]TDD74608.1 hypothetical protein E0F89_13960 [Flavobacterium caseinilyticum]